MSTSSRPCELASGSSCEFCTVSLLQSKTSVGLAKVRTMKRFHAAIVDKKVVIHRKS